MTIENLLPRQRTSADVEAAHTAQVEAFGKAVGLCGCGAGDRFTLDLAEVLAGHSAAGEPHFPRAISPSYLDVALHVLTHAGLLEHGPDVHQCHLTASGQQWLAALA